MYLKVLLVIYSILRSFLKYDPPSIVNPYSINKNSRNAPCKKKKKKKGPKEKGRQSRENN